MVDFAVPSMTSLERPIPFIVSLTLPLHGNGTPLQYSCLENPMDGGAWCAAVHGVAESWTRLHFDFSLSCIGEGNGNPLQCSCLENPRDGGAWWAAIYGGHTESDMTEATSSWLAFCSFLLCLLDLFLPSPVYYSPSLSLNLFSSLMFLSY